MGTAVTELEKLALALSEEDRAHLAASILESLPGVLSDPDEGVAEALRRDAEFESGSARPLSLNELEAAIRHRRK